MDHHPLAIDRPATPWQGRLDGTTPEHLRWHQLINQRLGAQLKPADFAILGFSSDAGVHRNQGRVGAAAGPAALRQALAPMAIEAEQPVVDLGDVVVLGDELESGQERLSVLIERLIQAEARPIVLGGGHESVYGSFLGLHRALRARGNHRVGVLNLDAHFDLRTAPRRSSGTPFNDIAQYLQQQGEAIHYAALGISRPSNTTALFDRAVELSVDYLLDEQCGSWSIGVVRDFVQCFLEPLDRVQLSIDLDVLPASVAPGVSAPGGFGVPYEVIREVCHQVAASGKLALLEVVELNPRFDIDQRTARSAARLIETIVRNWVD